jgi:hypothetical protein
MLQPTSRSTTKPSPSENASFSGPSSTGKWHCALSRQRELPEWLDQSVETHHADLALAILTAYLEVSRQPPRQPTRPSVPRVQFGCFCCENFS